MQKKNISKNISKNIANILLTISNNEGDDILNSGEIKK